MLGASRSVVRKSTCSTGPSTWRMLDRTSLLLLLCASLKGEMDAQKVDFCFARLHFRALPAVLTPFTHWEHFPACLQWQAQIYLVENVTGQNHLGRLWSTCWCPLLARPSWHLWSPMPKSPFPGAVRGRQGGCGLKCSWESPHNILFKIHYLLTIGEVSAAQRNTDKIHD